MPRLPGTMLCGLLAVAACSGPPAPPPSDPCLDLLAAAPHEWGTHLGRVHALGPAASPRLVALVREDPAAPGAPAAVALLGRLGGEGVVPALQDLVVDRSPLAVEAALALGELRANDAVPSLRACAGDVAADPTLRTAAACALVRCGSGREAIPLLHAVLLAGSPAGVAPGRAQGLPERPRWALERYLVQRLLLAEGEPALALALDPDASWPELAAVTADVVRWLEQR